MREALIWVFCLASLAMLTVGKSYEQPSLFRAYEAFEGAAQRGDWRRAARFGEAALKAARGHALMDGQTYLRLQLEVAEAQEQAGNRQRALGLYESALASPAVRENVDLLLSAGSGLSRTQEVFAGASLREAPPPDRFSSQAPPGLGGSDRGG